MKKQRSYIHVTIPADCVHLVSDLVLRLGGHVHEGGDGSFPPNPLPDLDRGGPMLKGLRKLAGLTQKDVAKALELPQNHISDFETGKRNIPYKYAQKLSNLLHTDPGYFIRFNTEMMRAINEAHGEQLDGMTMPSSENELQKRGRGRPRKYFY